MDEVGGPRRERRRVPEARPIESGPPSELMEVGHGIESAIRGLETKVELAVRRRTMLIVVVVLVGIVVLVIGAWVVIDQRQGNAQRAQIAEAVDGIEEAVQEIKDCTTPTVPSDCSRRTAAAGAAAIGKVRADIKTAAVAGALCGQMHQRDEAAVMACVDRFFPAPP